MWFLAQQLSFLRKVQAITNVRILESLWYAIHIAISGKFALLIYQPLLLWHMSTSQVDLNLYCYYILCIRICVWVAIWMKKQTNISRPYIQDPTLAKYKWAKEKDLSFPSLHATVASTHMFAASYFSGATALSIGIWLATVMVVSISRMAIGVHFPVDVFVGTFMPVVVLSTLLPLAPYVLLQGWLSSVIYVILVTMATFVILKALGSSSAWSICCYQLFFVVYVTLFDQLSIVSSSSIIVTGSLVQAIAYFLV